MTIRLLEFPCASCDRDLSAVPLVSTLDCPCGAGYAIGILTVLGVQGVAVMLARATPTDAVACPRCGIRTLLGECPQFGLLFVRGEPRAYLIDHAAQLCAGCGTEISTNPDDIAPPARWCAFAEPSPAVP